jgi:environmental stress-induced protein Ves
MTQGSTNDIRESSPLCLAKTPAGAASERLGADHAGLTLLDSSGFVKLLLVSSSRIDSFDIASLPATPWKNGGGTTREIVRVPAGADLDAFDWRVSIAELLVDGSFSSFAGIDRVIVLLEGAGIHMRSRDRAIDHRLATPFVPFVFSGDQPIDATLIVGQSRDFNVMTRRLHVRADVRVLRDHEKLPESESGLLFAARGRWRAQAASGRRVFSFAPGAGVWWDRHPLAWDLSPSDADNALIAVSIQHIV